MAPRAFNPAVRSGQSAELRQEDGKLLSKHAQTAEFSGQGRGGTIREPDPGVTNGPGERVYHLGNT